MRLQHHVKVLHLAGFPPTQQWSPSRHTATARVKLNKEVNKVVIKCFHRNKPFDETEISLSDYSKRTFK